MALGIDVMLVRGIREGDDGFDLLDEGKVEYIVYTGALYDATVKDYMILHRRALQHGIVCLTSLDTANALADIIASRYNEDNTELVDINHMRTERAVLRFSKMQGCGDDYIFIDNFDGSINCPESLCITMCARHYGVGADGIVLIEHSDIADARMRIFNRDGSEGRMAGNCIRCTAKYLYDKNICKKERMRIETVSGVKTLDVYTSTDKVTYVTVDMGRANLEGKNVPCTLSDGRIIDMPTKIGGKDYRITCVSMGNPHCVVFCDKVDAIDLDNIGPRFENAPIFPERVNTEFIRVVNEATIKMRVFERGNGETFACGTGACAAVVAACENGYCSKGKDITVKLRGGDLVVNYTDERVTLSGDANLVYDGVCEY